MISLVYRILPIALVLAACSEDPNDPADPVTLVEITPAAPGLSPGDTLHLHAAVSGPRGRLFDRPVTWSSSNPAVATVTDSGVVLGVGNGAVSIRAMAEGVVDSVLLPISRPFKSVSVADRSVCALRSNGAAYCWGYALTGRLGWSGASDTAGPVPVAGGLIFSTLTSGGAHSCGIVSNGDAWCWGSNFQGELDGSPANPNGLSFVPVAVGNQAPFTDVAADYNYSCGLDAAGLAYCWGYTCSTDINGFFFCWGNGTSSPTGGSVALVSISAGFNHMCGLSTTGSAYCWGSNSSGQLGVAGATGGPTPVQVTLPAPVRSISAADGYSCGVTVNDDGYCWGRNSSNQLGTGNGSSTTTPVLVSGSHKWAEIAAGEVETCGVALDGITYCWGYLGAGSNPSVPLAITGRSFDQISVGTGVACGLTAGGAIYCWGNGSQGQLGNGLKVNTLQPVRALDP